MNSGNTFIKQLRSRSISKKENKKLLEQKRLNIIYTKNNYIVQIKKNDEYEIEGKKEEFIEKKQFEAKVQGKIITIKNGEKKVKSIKVKKSTIDDIKEKIKEEINFSIKLEDINELKIKQQLKKIIKEDKEKINKIDEELDKIKDCANKYKLTEEINQLEEKIKKLKEELDKIKNHYIIISEYYEFKGYEELKNELLLSSIEDYQFYQTTSQLDELVKKCQEEGKKINKVIKTYEECLESEKKVLEIKKYTEKRDNEYLDKKNKVDLVNKSYEKVIENFKKQDEFLENINTDLYYIESKINHKNIYKKSKSLFNNLFNMGMYLTLMPIFPNIRILLQLMLIKNSVEATHKLLNPEIEITFTNSIIKEYLNLIFEKNKMLEETEKLLNETTKNIKDLKKEYIDKFGEYKTVYKDYQLYLTKIEQMEETLEKKTKQIKEAQNTLQKSKEKAKQLKRES